MLAPSRRPPQPRTSAHVNEAVVPYLLRDPQEDPPKQSWKRVSDEDVPALLTLPEKCFEQRRAAAQQLRRRHLGGTSDVVNRHAAGPATRNRNLSVLGEIEQHLRAATSDPNAIIHQCDRFSEFVRDFNESKPTILGWAPGERGHVHDRGRRLAAPTVLAPWSVAPPAGAAGCGGVHAIGPVADLITAATHGSGRHRERARVHERDRSPPSGFASSAMMAYVFRPGEVVGRRWCQVVPPAPPAGDHFAALILHPFEAGNVFQDRELRRCGAVGPPGAATPRRHILDCETPAAERHHLQPQLVRAESVLQNSSRPATSPSDLWFSTSCGFRDPHTT